MPSVVATPTEMIRPVQGDGSQQSIHLGGAHAPIGGGLTTRAGNFFLRTKREIEIDQGAREC